mmetsp:Transcript_101702/g.180304  ORF Transcript_101702/g.180304 Transcript_101702/m.180304 type:complete len:207 (-) Transcript_101702:242-862(-)
MLDHRASQCLTSLSREAVGDRNANGALDTLGSHTPEPRALQAVYISYGKSLCNRPLQGGIEPNWLPLQQNKRRRLNQRPNQDKKHNRDCHRCDSVKKRPIEISYHQRGDNHSSRTHSVPQNVQKHPAHVCAGSSCDICVLHSRAIACSTQRSIANLQHIHVGNRRGCTSVGTACALTSGVGMQVGMLMEEQQASKIHTKTQTSNHK